MRRLRSRKENVLPKLFCTHNSPGNRLSQVDALVGETRGITTTKAVMNSILCLLHVEGELCLNIICHHLPAGNAEGAFWHSQGEGSCNYKVNS